MEKINHKDVLILGAGIIGCAIARELSFFNLDIGVLEKNNYVGMGQSKANGGIIHAGHNEKPGSLKSKLCLEGNRLYPKLCKDLGVKLLRKGYFVIAFDDNEIGILNELKKQSDNNGVRTKILDYKNLIEMEPNISSEAQAALFIEDAGIVDVHNLVIALAENAVINDVKFFFNTEVIDLIKNKSSVVGVLTTNGKYYSKVIINCAGINSRQILKSIGINYIKIIPRKGEYYILDKIEQNLVQRPFYMVPSKKSKGVTVFPTVNGNIVFGGNSAEVKNKNDTSTTNLGFLEVYEKALKMFPKLNTNKIITSFAGIRASTESGDFIIKEFNNAKGLINLIGIDSPGVTAAPAIAKYVKEIINDNYINFIKNNNKYNNYNINTLFKDKSSAEKNNVFKKDNRFGRIICRCENITEGDIIAAINSPIPAITIDSIKFKTKAGFGRCQGAFCLSRIIEIISNETGLKPYEVLKNNNNSNIILN